MLGRTICCVAVAVLAVGPAAADPAKMCGGKYAHAAQLIEAAYSKYGALYSGGNHFSEYDNVGATLDLYRFWKGYPDLNLREGFQAPGYSRNEPDFGYQGSLGDGIEAPELWSRAEWVLKRDAQVSAGVKPRFYASWGFDILTSVGPRPGWWREPDKFDDLTPSQKWVADMARREPALDWMQTALAASRMPLATNWGQVQFPGGGDFVARQIPVYDMLAEDAFAKYKAGQGYEWLAVAAGLAPIVARYNDITTELNGIRAGVKACTASPQAYAAFLAGWLPMQRDLSPVVEYGPARMDAAYNDNDDIPQTLQRFSLDANAQRAVFYATEQQPFRDLNAELLRLMKARAQQNSWGAGYADIASIYLAARIEDVPAVGDGYARRAYGLLSAARLTELSRRPKQADPKNALTNDLLRTAFARHVALGRTDAAKALLPDVIGSLPERADALRRIWARAAPEDVRLALIILEAPEISTIMPCLGDAWTDQGLVMNCNYTSGHRNLPREYVSGVTLERDHAYFVRREFGADNTEWSRRPGQRGLELPNMAPRSVLQRGPGQGAPFARMIAYAELSRLTGDERLLHTVARTLVGWADKRTDNWFKRTLGNHEPEADALARLIRVCRRETCGEYGGADISRRAFRLLKLRMPNTAAAKGLKYWWAGNPDF